jgi:hypothetical protein
MTPLGLARLQLDEGDRLFVYDDKTGLSIGQLPSGGWPTIGYGRNLATNGITADEAVYLLQNSVVAVEKLLSGTYPWLVGRFNTIPTDVITMVHYNTGNVGNFVRMLAAAKASDWPTMAAELMDSLAARELPARYQRMHDALLSGTWKT